MIDIETDIKNENELIQTLYNSFVKFNDYWRNKEDITEAELTGYNKVHELFLECIEGHAKRLERLQNI